MQHQKQQQRLTKDTGWRCTSNIKMIFIVCWKPMLEFF